MPRNSNLTRRSLLAGVAATLAAPALGQSQGAFDQIGPDADPNDLIDQIWDPKREAFITVRELIDQLEQSPIILIGERHGFAPHQNRAAFILKALADRGRYPTLALEMLEPAQEPVINAYRARNPEYARGLGITLDWANTGWPDWSFYEPIFDAAFAAKLPIVGADLPQQMQDWIVANGFPDNPENQQIIPLWSETLERAYCGSLSGERLEFEAKKQWRREVAMQEAISASQDCVFIGGREHLQTDRSILTEIKNQLVLELREESDFDRSVKCWLTPNGSKPASFC